MKFLIAVPDHPYYLWQVLVQINNFRKIGIEQDALYVVGIMDHKPSEILEKFLQSPNIKAKFCLVNDDRIIKGYTSSLRPFILSQYYKVFPAIASETVFYLDPDVIFTKPMDFTQFEKDDIWYVSNTTSYIDSTYIKSKSPELFVKMCEIVKIDPDFVSSQDSDAGGAQYIMKNINADFWEKVYNDSEALYKLMTETSSIYHPEHPIQAWTADMWSVLWNGWYFGNRIKISRELDFSWASDTANRWSETNIFHDAGIVQEDGRNFSKVTYQVSPFNKEIQGTEESCSWGYIKEIKETEINFPELLF